MKVSVDILKNSFYENEMASIRNLYLEYVQQSLSFSFHIYLQCILYTYIKV